MSRFTLTYGVFAGFDFSDQNLSGEVLAGNYMGSSFDRTDLRVATLSGDFSDADLSQSVVDRSTEFVGTFAGTHLPPGVTLRGGYHA